MKAQYQQQVNIIFDFVCEHRNIEGYIMQGKKSDTRAATARACFTYICDYYDIPPLIMAEKLKKQTMYISHMRSKYDKKPYNEAVKEALKKIIEKVEI